MKIKVKNIGEYKDRDTKRQCCINRGISPTFVDRYLTNSFEDIYPPEVLGESLLREGAILLSKAISDNEKAWICVDSDVDGLTSAALLINYLYELFPAWVENNVSWSLHEGKGHGLSEFIDDLEEKKYGLVICPDSATNDISEIERLHKVGTEVLILDHHLSESEFSPYAVTINCQYDYPNPDISAGVVVLKFCQYLDKLGGRDLASKYYDLAAVSAQSDMMDIRSLETKEIIFKGFQMDAINNPLIYNIIQKNNFSINKADYVASHYNNLELTPMACSFFCTPLLNAVCRSGTQEEKELTFRAMLTKEAFKEIPSTKRGHTFGEMETVVTQMTRQITNIKNRQTRSEEKILSLLESKIKENPDILKNKVLVFALEPDEAEPTLRGLAANKLMAKYQRPVCVVTKGKDKYSGSMRGYTATGIESFKDIAQTSPQCLGVIGHSNAAGIMIKQDGLDAFVEDMNKALENISTEIVYYVDYIWEADEVDGEAIVEMARLNDYLGQGFPRPLVYVKNCTIKDNFMLMGEESSHLKITLGKTSIILWNIGESLKEDIVAGRHITLNFVAKCNINEWNGISNPQLIVENYELVKEQPKIDLLSSWGF